MTSLRLPSLAALLLVAVLPWVSGCADESLTAPNIENDLFNSYVALGNSITAGFQGNGINRSTQQSAFPQLLARQMNTPFGLPELAEPGCPPPYVQFFDASGIPSPQRPSGTSGATCGLRDAGPPPQVNNVAVPGARVVDVMSNETASANTLTQFILGGRTQIEAALDADPTFATVWIGNNNVLGPALSGTDNVTPQSTFENRYTSMLDQLTGAENFQGGVLIGVANVTFTPFFSPGPVYAGLEQQGQFPPNFEVAANCDTTTAEGLSPLISIQYGFTVLGQAVNNPGQTVTLDCAAADTPVLTLQEVGTLAATVRNYNEFIAEEAANRDLAFYNPNTIFGPLYQVTGGDQDPTNDPIPKFPARSSNEPFGTYFSLDGVHPSSATHRVVTNEIIAEINDTYGTSLQPIQAPTLPIQ